MSRFSIGQRVKCIRASGGLKEGYTYEIRHIYGSFCDVKSDTGRTLVGWKKTRFEPVIQNTCSDCISVCKKNDKDFNDCPFKEVK